MPPPARHVTVLVVAREPERLTSVVSRDGVSEVALVPSRKRSLTLTSTGTLSRKPSSVAIPTSHFSRPLSTGGVSEPPSPRSSGWASQVRPHDPSPRPATSYRRSFYLEKAIGELESTSRLGTLLLLRPGAWSAATGTSSPLVTSEAITPVESRTRHVEYVTASTDDDVDISQADVILAIGRGIRSQENSWQ